MDALAIRSASTTLPGMPSLPVHIQTTSSRCCRWLPIVRAVRVACPQYSTGVLELTTNSIKIF